jgi:SAM-dependent methyltransferase
MVGSSNEKATLAELVGGNRTVLDCGCGGGEVARLLAANGCEVFGIDAVPRIGELARPSCKAVVIGDLESEDTLAEIRRRQPSFDCVVCSHVLEHLRDPELTLKRLVALVRPDGAVVVALPNVAHWKMRVELMRGRWEYQNAGILDRTHFRFFTLESAKALLKAAGCRIEQVVVPEFNGPTPLHSLVRGTMRALTTPTFFSQSFVFKCTVNSSQVPTS